MSKRKTKAFLVDFTNSQGVVVGLLSKLTMGDLAKAGITLRLEPKENPKDNDPRQFYHEP